MKLRFILILSMFYMFPAFGQTKDFFSLTDTVFRCGQIYTTKNIWFKLAMCELREESYEELDNISDFLDENPNIIIEFSFNYKYSMSECYYIHSCRIEEILNYLINKGIRKQQICGKNYFGSNPYTITKDDIKNYPFLKEGDVLTDDFIKNLKTKRQKQVARFLNRHIEIKIIKT